MSNHTQGPWRYTADEDGINFRLLAGDQEIIGGCGCCDSPWIVGMDNARLIAAAPELKAENERLKAECDVLRRHLNYWLPDETMVPQGHESAYRAACAALAAREAK